MEYKLENGRLNQVQLGLLEAELDEAEFKAIDALGRYKFTMFGYWAGIWVHLNKLLEDKKRPNPFRNFVVLAKDELETNSFPGDPNYRFTKTKTCEDLSCDCDLESTGSWPPKHIPND